MHLAAGNSDVTDNSVKYAAAVTAQQGIQASRIVTDETSAIISQIDRILGTDCYCTTEVVNTATVGARIIFRD